MTKILTLIVIYLFGKIDASNDSFVITPKMAQSCKEHMCTDGYTYSTVYMVDSNEMREIKRDTDMAFEMHLAIQAMSNGHILLSSVPKPVSTDRVYEFVVGGGGNRFTELRGHLKRDAKASIKTEKILSTFELRGFYIKISQDGLIEFGKEGEILPLISYNDVDPIEIKYFSFAAWSGVEAKFLYDCPVPLANGSEISGNSEEIDRPISAANQLKRDLLKYRLPWLSPTPTMDVRLGVKITSVKYNAFQSKLETGVSVVVSWIDDSLAWYPAKYNGTKRLKFRQGQIWSPKFYVFNSDDQQVLAGRNSELVSMESTGEATYHFQTKVNTWCIDSAEDLNKWPHDEYDCTVLIQPWDVHEKITIINMDITDKKMKIFSDIDPEIKNEWEAKTKQMMVIKPSTWNRVYDTDDITTQQSDRLFINIQVKRSAKPYNIVFYTPLLVLMTFVLLSFWSEPLTMNRVWFLAGCTIVICMGLCYIDYLVPSHSLPSILILYTVVLGGVLTALLLQVLLMTKTMDNVCSSSIMQRVFTCRIFRIIFCLPAFKFQMAVNGNYILQEDDEPIAERGSDIEEMEREKANTYCDKKELAEVMDRVLFVTYSVTFAALLAAHF